LELDIEIKHIDLVAGDQRKPEFLKLNPRNKVPVLVDGDFVLCESKAIMAYLVNSRKPGSSLYPVDAKQRAKVDQFLYYDATVVFPSLSALVVSSKIFEL
jgi:glutathione S-transferase